jgi:hypothetical protein
MATKDRILVAIICGLKSLLNTSINKKLVFFLEVVVCKKSKHVIIRTPHWLFYVWVPPCLYCDHYGNISKSIDDSLNFHI